MDRRRSKDIIQQPHPSREFRFSKDPTAAQSAETECFCEAAGNNKLWSKFEGSAGAPFKQCLDIDFINEHTCAIPPRKFSNSSQRLIARQNAAWIMQIRQHNQSRV